jgi:uncharacterized membrane protein
MLREKIFSMFSSIGDFICAIPGFLLHAIPWVVGGIVVYLVIGMITLMFSNFIDGKQKNGNYLHFSEGYELQFFLWPLFWFGVMIMVPMMAFNAFLVNKTPKQQGEIIKIPKKRAKRGEVKVLNIYGPEILNRHVEKKLK